jgi:hypothetical protein
MAKKPARKPKKKRPGPVEERLNHHRGPGGGAVQAVQAQAQEGSATRPQEAVAADLSVALRSVI